MSITAADLGHKPGELERNLMHFFKSANNWDGVVLLDEADVYLERRSTSDLKRNSIVSSSVPAGFQENEADLGSSLSPRARLLPRNIVPHH